MKIIKTILLYSIFLIPNGYLLSSSPDQILSEIKEQQSFSGNKEQSRALEIAGQYMSSGGPEIASGIKTILARNPARTENYALTLFLYLLEHGAYTEKDTITIAMALANNYIYSLADDETKDLIKKGMLEHYEFYRETSDMQRASGFSWNISDSPLTAKIFWCDRAGLYLGEINDAMARKKLSKMDRETYEEFADSVNTLKYLQKIYRTENILKKSVRKTAESIENFVHQRRVYRSSMENLEDFYRRKMIGLPDLEQARKEYRNGEYEKMHMGKKRRWDDFRWLNYQVRDLYARKEIFMGDCGDTTVVQIGFYKAAGIPAISFQYIDASGKAAYTHNFPVYYHFNLKRWISVQKPVFYGEGGSVITNPVPEYLHFTKPVYHHLSYVNNYSYSRQKNQITYAYYPGELGNQNKIFNLLENGMSEDHLDGIFYSNRTLTSGLFFNPESTAPFQDTDGDGLSDLHEKTLGTNPAKMDTDGDGVSDLYEMENGRNPLQAEKFDPENPPVDGIVNENPGTGGYAVAYDPQGDYKSSRNIYDIKSAAARIVEKNLYVGVTYHNSIKGNKLNLFSIQINLLGGSRKKYWLQWVNDYAAIYEMKGPDNLIKLDLPGMEHHVLRDAEFLIPMDFFRDADALLIQVIGAGTFMNKTLIADDILPLLRISVSDSDWAWDVEKKFSGKTYDDPSGDAKPSGRDLYDISSFGCMKENESCICRTAFHNDIAKNDFGLHMLHFRNDDSGENYWAQFWSADGRNMLYWKDGQKPSVWNGNTDKMDIAFIQNTLYFKIPFSFLKSFKVQYRAGSTKDGKSLTDLDTSEFMDLPE